MDQYRNFPQLYSFKSVITLSNNFFRSSSFVSPRFLPINRMKTQGSKTQGRNGDQYNGWVLGWRRGEEIEGKRERVWLTFDRMKRDRFAERQQCEPSGRAARP